MAPKLYTFLAALLLPATAARADSVPPLPASKSAISGPARDNFWESAVGDDADLPPAGTCVLSVRLVSEPGGLHREGGTFIGDGFGLYEAPNGTLVIWRHEGDHTFSGKKRPINEVWTLQTWQASRLRTLFRKKALDHVSLNPYFVPPTDLRTRTSEIPIVINGAETRAVCHWEGVDFDFSTSQLEYHLDDLAKKDPKGAELRDLLDAVSQLIGRHAMQLE